MEQIVYTSSASDGIGAADVFDIIAASARNNPQREVTGFLVFTGNAFLQLVEGPTARLDELLGVLGGDPRHCDLSVVSRCSIDTRSFPNWRMHRFDANVGDPAPVIAALREHRAGRGTIAQVEAFLQSSRQTA